MELYKTLNLPVELVQSLQSAGLEESKSLPLEGLARRYLSAPKQILGEFLAQNYPQLPELWNCILFYREPGVQQPIHLDSYSTVNPNEPLYLIDCAINIPLLNCSSSSMQWYQGEYQVVEDEGPFFNDNQGNPVTRRFLRSEWEEGVVPTVFDEVVVDSPMLVRISRPHAVSVTNETRMCMSFRFNGDITFEDVAAALP